MRRWCLDLSPVDSRKTAQSERCMARAMGIPLPVGDSCVPTDRRAGDVDVQRMAVFKLKEPPPLPRHTVSQNLLRLLVGLSSVTVPRSRPTAMMKSLFALLLVFTL